MRPAPRRGFIWLTAAGVLAVVLGIELFALAAIAMGEQRAVAAMEAQIKASYAAEAGVAVVRAALRKGRLPRRTSGAIGDGRYEVRAQREGGQVRVLSTGRSRGPMGIEVVKTIEVVCGLRGAVREWRYVRPLEPAPAGKT